MAIQYVANALGATNSTTSFSITLPTTAADDILILEFAHRGTGDGTIGGTSVSTGGLTWTLKHSQPFASSAFSGKTYWARATTNHAGQTVTGSGLTNSCAAILTRYSGVDTGADPLGDATIVGEQNASGNEAQAAITTATNGAYVVLVVVNSPDFAISNQSASLTLVERAELLSTGGTDTSVAHASGELATAGSSGTFSWTQTNAISGSWAYAIKPLAAVTTTLTPDAAAVAVSGFAPTINQSSAALTPDAAALSLSGHLASLTTTTTPAAGSVALTGNAPAVAISTPVTFVAQPAAGAAALTGYAPTIVQALAALTPASGTVTITGFAPALQTTLFPGTGTVAITGYTPGLTTTVFPDVGSVNVTGHTPTASVTAGIEPATATLALTGYGPTLLTTLSPAAGALAITAYTPVTAQSTTSPVTFVAQPGAGSLSVTGYAPTISQVAALTPAAGTVTLAGFAPTLLTGIAGTWVLEPGAGTVAITGYAPTPRIDILLTPATASLTLAGHAPVLETLIPVDPATAITVTGYAPALRTTLTPGADTLDLVGYAPNLAALYPFPGDVREGTVYGPGGIYTGTLKRPSTWLRRR